MPLPLPFEALGHTADVRLKVTGRSLEELFCNALKGMAHVMKPGAKASDATRSFEVNAVDSGALLVDFLNEALYLASVHKEVYTDIVFLAFGDTHCKGELKGEAIEGFDKDIKAATHHDLEITQREDGYYEATIIFDL